MKISPDIPALLIIDMQNDFVQPDAPAVVAGAKATVPRIREILDFFRKQKWPVFHVNREYRADGSNVEWVRRNQFIQGHGFCIPGTKGCESVGELTPEPGEYRIVKPRFSAFMETDLDLILRNLDIKTIVVCGTQYPNCIRTTVFDGIAYGYYVMVITDATSAQTETVAEANIRDMENIGVQCLNTDTFLATMKNTS